MIGVNEINRQEFDKAQDIQHLVAAAFPNRKVARTELLAGGLINTNLKIYFESDFYPVVLRLYRDGALACEKEIAVHNLIGRHVPVPEILHAEGKRSPAFAVVEYVEGLTFQQLKRTNNLEAIQQASASIGKTLAAIGRFRFPAPGALQVTEAGLAVGKKFIEGPDPIPRILDQFLASTVFLRRADSKLVDQLHNFVWSYASKLPSLETDCSLVHNDFGNRLVECLTHDELPSDVEAELFALIDAALPQRSEITIGRGQYQLR